MAGHIRYESLLGTELSLYDILLLNEAMDCKAENEDRLIRAAESKARMAARRR